MPQALPFQTAKQLAAAIRKKKIGCLELLDLYLERVKAYNPELNAIIAMDVEGARKRARAADKAVKAGRKLGPLHGVPMTIKESFDVAGYPTTWGDPAFKDTVIAKNSLVAQRMTDAIHDARDESRGRETVIVSHQLPIWIARLHAEDRRLWHDPRKRECSLASLTSFEFEGDRLAAVTYSEPAADLLPGAKGRGA